MKKYDVHICAVVLVKLGGIEAESQREAIEKAKERFHEEHLGDALGLRVLVPGADAEYAEDVLDYLVVDEDDTEHERSEWYAPEDLEQNEEGKEVEHAAHRCAARSGRHGQRRQPAT